MCTRLLFIVFFFSFNLLFSSSSSLPVLNSTTEFDGYTAMSDFRIINRRILPQCPDPDPFLQFNISSISGLPDEENVVVTVSGLSLPDESDWIAMISPSHSDISNCPWNDFLCKQTGNCTDQLPLLCHYPVEAKYLSTDPDYLDRREGRCIEYTKGACALTFSGSLTFHVINIRTDIEFVFFSGGLATPCLLKMSGPVSFKNPQSPLYGHLSSIDSTGESMRLTWVSGDKRPQQIKYGDGRSETSTVTTFAQDDMCTTELLPSPANDFGWHDPGYVHSAVMSGLQPSTSYHYTYGSDSVGWSDSIKFRTPPPAGADELKFLAFSNMGKTPRDPSLEHYVEPGALSVVEAMTDEVASGDVDSVFHIGGMSYSTGFLVEWDYFLHLITPIASHVSYMTAIGNHERDYMDSGSMYTSPDSGGECGVPYETYFPMPTAAKDKPWYSIELASVHFTVISTEHGWTHDSEQYAWMKEDLESVDRSRTPWVIFTGHRPMYTSAPSILSMVEDPDQADFANAVEPLLMANKVDLALFGHVHNYERTCAVYQQQCKGMPTKDKDGVDTYNNNNYTAPVHAVIGMAGFTLDQFPDQVEDWSLSRVAEFGYLRVFATREIIKVEFVNSKTREVEDSFCITKQRAFQHAYSTRMTESRGMLDDLVLPFLSFGPKLCNYLFGKVKSKFGASI